MKKLLLLLTLHLSVWSTNAQEIFAPEATKAEVITTSLPVEIEEDSLLLIDRKIPLYTVEKQNYPTSYLMGTIHLVPEIYAVRMDAYEFIFEMIDQVYLEIADMDQMGAIKFARDQKKDKAFLSYFTTAQQDSIFAYAEAECGLQKGMIKMSSMHYKPMILQQMLMVKKDAKRVSQYSYDIDIAKIARNYDLPVKGFETVKEQIGFFSNQDSISLNESVMSIVRNPNQDGDQNELYRLYFTRDLDGMHKFMTEAFDDPLFRNTVLDKRNLKWMKKIPGILKKKATMIAVGAGHLAGETGLIPLLEKQGFKITPVIP